MRDDLFLQMLQISVTMIPLILLLKLVGNRLQKVYVAKWKYCIWLVLAVRLLLPWSPTFTIPTVEIKLPDNIVLEHEAPEYIYNDALMEESPGQEQVLQVSAKVEKTVSGEEQEDLREQESFIAQEPSVAKKTWKMPDILTLAEIIWLAVAISSLGYHVAAHLYAERKLRRWSRPAEEAFLEQVSATLGEEKLPEQLKLFINSQIAGPMVVGLYKPRLYLPEKDYTSRELQFVLRHELVHYYRKDLWYKALLLTVNIVHWFNPFVYLMCREAEKDLECSCDSMVMKGAEKEKRCSYARLIVDTATDKCVDRRLLTSNFYGGAEDLKRRLQNIMDTGKKKNGIATFALVIAVSVSVGGLVGFKLGESNASQITTGEVREVQEILEVLEEERVTEKAPVETAPPTDKKFESPITFLDENLIQEVDKSQECTRVQLGSGNYQWVSAWKKEGVTQPFYELEYGDDIHYEIKDGALKCEVGLYQGLDFYRGVAELTYIYENGEYVVDKERAQLFLDWAIDTMARNSLRHHSQIMVEKDGLMLDQDAVDDGLTLHRVVDKDEAYNVLTVYLGNGMTTSYRLPSNHVTVNDISHIYTLPFRSNYYKSIVVMLSDTELTKTQIQSSADYYILHVEVDEESGEAKIVEDVAVLDTMRDSENYEQHRDTFLEFPCYYVTDDSDFYYHEDLEALTLRIRGLSEETREEAFGYVYWDGEIWKSYFE